MRIDHANEWKVHRLATGWSIWHCFEGRLILEDALLQDRAAATAYLASQPDDQGFWKSLDDWRMAEPGEPSRIDALLLILRRAGAPLP